MKNKKPNKILIFIILIMGILLIGTGTYLYIGNNNKEETKKEELK